MNKIYTSVALSNDDYHSEKYPQSSGSILWAMRNDCPAAYKFGQRKETKALSDGTAIHCAMLEADRFGRDYVRGINPSEKEYLVTNADMKSWLQGAGMKVPSAANKADMIEMLRVAKCDIPILEVDTLHLESFALSTQKTILPYETFDLIQKMQTALNNSGYLIRPTHLIEVSCVDEFTDLKCRWDIVVTVGDKNPAGGIAEQGEVWDYKTTISASPELFAASALKYGYWCKMALQADLYEAQFGVKPSRVVLLAQSKTEPYIAQAYELTEQQLDIGREQYKAAKVLLDRCKLLSDWPAYGGNIETLQTPAWAANMYGFEDTIELIEE